jgi:hypothetical protein
VADTAVTITSSSAEVEVGDGGLIIVPNGALSAPVPLLGVTGTDGGLVTLTATLGTDTRTAQVRVLNATDVPRLVGLDPGTANVVAGGTQVFTVRLDLPAAGPTAVTLALVPNTVGTAPMTVTVPADATSATFTAQIDSMATGTGTLTATLAADMFSSTVTVQQVPVTNHIVLSEVAALGPQGASDEFVELYNPTNADVDVSGWILQYRSATGTTWNNKVTLPMGTTIVAGGFFLITSSIAGSSGTNGYPATGVAPDIRHTAELGLAAAGGHVRMVNNMLVEVDKLGYGTGLAPEGTVLTPVHASGGSFERKALPTSTAATMATGGADALSGNGNDSDNNAADFTIRVVREPQNRTSATE